MAVHRQHCGVQTGENQAVFGDGQWVNLMLAATAAHALTLCDDEGADCQSQQQERNLQGERPWVVSSSRHAVAATQRLGAAAATCAACKCACSIYISDKLLSKRAGPILTRRAMLLEWSGELIECR
jgi:hypothetical protein